MEQQNPFFSQNLKRLLKEKKKTQIELSKFLNTSGATVSYWIKGRNLPEHYNVDKICQFLNVTRDELLGNPEHQPKKDDFKIQFFEGYDYDKLPEAKKEKIRQFIKLLLED